MNAAVIALWALVAILAVVVGVAVLLMIYAIVIDWLVAWSKRRSK